MCKRVSSARQAFSVVENFAVDLKCWQCVNPSSVVRCSQEAGLQSPKFKGARRPEWHQYDVLPNSVACQHSPSPISLLFLPHFLPQHKQDETNHSQNVKKTSATSAHPNPPTAHAYFSPSRFAVTVMLQSTETRGYFRDWVAGQRMLRRIPQLLPSPSPPPTKKILFAAAWIRTEVYHYRWQ